MLRFLSLQEHNPQDGQTKVHVCIFHTYELKLNAVTNIKLEIHDTVKNKCQCLFSISYFTASTFVRLLRLYMAERYKNMINQQFNIKKQQGLNY